MPSHKPVSTSASHRRDPPPPALIKHLHHWLGAWPPRGDLEVVGATQRLAPGWDGRIHPALGIADPAIGAVLSVPPAAAAAVRRRTSTGGVDAVLSALPEALGQPDRGTYQAAFRWTTEPAELPEPGEWVPATAPGLPEWLRPFGGHVLVATAPDGTHLAGVGVKRHDLVGHELAVVTTPAARGRGLARALVGQAARRLLRTGVLPTYLHDPTNTASARVAEAAGFPDRGWTSFGLSEELRDHRDEQGSNRHRAPTERSAQP